MRFYTKQHKFYCGIDLHTNKMYLCILDETGEIRLHQNIKTDRELFLKVIAPYQATIVVAVEGMFTWYRIADLCFEEGIPFVPGQALYMKAIHGGKAKNDKIDSGKIAVLLKGGMMPQAYAYPAKMRATRDLLPRRNHLMRKRAKLYAHIQNTRSRYNPADPFGRIAKPKNREDVAERFEDTSVQNMIASDFAVIAPSKARRIFQGESPCREGDQQWFPVRVSHPPVSSLGPMAELPERIGTEQDGLSAPQGHFRWA